MKVKLATFLPIVVLLAFLPIPAPLTAQSASAVVSGTVNGPSGAIQNAKVQIKSTSTGQITEPQTNAAGYYTANVPSGQYEISVSAQGFSPKTASVTLAPGTQHTVNLTLVNAGQESEPSLGELGFPTAETQPNPQEQARLNKRTAMLRTHQRLGLITTAPLLATVITGSMAGGRHGSSTGRDVHAALGSATAAMYFTTASYAIFAPKVPGTKTRGSIRAHKILAWIHGPGMVLTPALGIMAFQQRNRGEKVHGLASAHVPVAVVTAAAYGAAILSVSVKF